MSIFLSGEKVPQQVLSLHKNSLQYINTLLQDNIVTCKNDKKSHKLPSLSMFCQNQGMASVSVSVFLYILFHSSNTIFGGGRSANGSFFFSSFGFSGSGSSAFSFFGSSFFFGSCFGFSAFAFFCFGCSSSYFFAERREEIFLVEFWCIRTID